MHNVTFCIWHLRNTTNIANIWRCLFCHLLKMFFAFSLKKTAKIYFSSWPWLSYFFKSHAVDLTIPNVESCRLVATRHDLTTFYRPPPQCIQAILFQVLLCQLDHSKCWVMLTCSDSTQLDDILQTPSTTTSSILILSLTLSTQLFQTLSRVDS